MSASEIARRYGYNKFLSYIRKNLIFNRENDLEVKEANADVEEKADNHSILLKINRDKNGKIIICHEEFGEKETFDLNILKFMLKKDNIEATTGYVNDEEYLGLELMPQKLSFDDKLEEIYDNREEYLEALIEKANAAKKHTKILLNQAADWANKNL